MFGKTRAPELTGRGWLNTGGKSLSLTDLQGKIVLLDFWTFCCINCLHVLDELRPLEEKYRDVLVTVGVHSPKFEHEKDPLALADAVERYGVTHPVLDDPTMSTWQQYAARAWPTLCVVDPEGYLVATVSGEGHASGLASLFDKLIVTHSSKGTLNKGSGPYVAPEPSDTQLRFPSKAIVTSSGGYLVSSSAQHQIVELAADGETVVRRIGSGIRGSQDGGPTQAEFSEPQGLCYLPEEVAKEVGYEVLIADTVNHMLRGLRLADGYVTTVAGTGNQLHRVAHYGQQSATETDLSSPWDVAWFDGFVIIAMAGVHQLWWFDPVRGTVGIYAGTAAETLVDGPLEKACLAQPSGLSVGGDRLWIADSETSALRWTDGEELYTAVGQGLFDFGLVDGAARDALLQHPLGVCAMEDGSVLVADTYNGAIRRYDPDSDALSTVIAGLSEPSDLVVTVNGDIVIVESGAHRLSQFAADALSIAGIDLSRQAGGTPMHVERPETLIAPGELVLDVVFLPQPDQKLDDSFGPSSKLDVFSSPTSLIVDGAGSTAELSRRLVISSDVETGVLQVAVEVATCDVDTEFPACHLNSQNWGIPIRVSEEGVSQLSLMLRGVD